MAARSGAIGRTLRNVPDMEFRTWATLLGTTLASAAWAGASQLGLAYGIGILRFTRVFDVTARDQWTAQLAWVAWIAMTAGAVGGMYGRRRLPEQAGAGTRVLAAIFAGLGAAAVVPLTMQPARTTQVAEVNALLVIGICAGLGALGGVVAGYAALSRPAARWSFATLGITVWVVAIASVAPSLALGASAPAARLGVLDTSLLPPSLTQRTALFTMPVLALVLGVILGWVAGRRELSIPAIALAGLPGPALLTLAYLIAGPGSAPDRYQEVPYWAAMTVAGAGVLGSVLAVMLRRGPATVDHRPGTIGDGTGPGNAGTPPSDRSPLPRRDAQSRSAIARTAATRPSPAPGAARPSAPTAVSRSGAPPMGGFAPTQTAPRPKPRQISAPLPDPTPIVPPTRAKGRKKQAGDGEIADWVNSLGGGRRR